MTGEPVQAALWTWCVVCGGMRMVEQDVETEEPVQWRAHGRCDVAVQLWLRRVEFPPIPPGLPLDMMPPWSVKPNARVRRSARQCGVRRSAALDLRVVS
jgi:hypothetical protein